MGAKIKITLFKIKKLSTKIPLFKIKGGAFKDNFHIKITNFPKLIGRRGAQLPTLGIEDIHMITYLLDATSSSTTVNSSLFRGRAPIVNKLFSPS